MLVDGDGEGGVCDCGGEDEVPPDVLVVDARGVAGALAGVDVLAAAGSRLRPAVSGSEARPIRWRTS